MLEMGILALSDCLSLRKENCNKAFLPRSASSAQSTDLKPGREISGGLPEQLSRCDVGSKTN